MNKNETFNGLRDYPVTGHYFELLSTVNPVDVTLYGEGDVVLASEKQVITGYYVDRRGKEPFQRFEITTGALEAVKWFATDGTGGQKTASAVVAQTVPASGLAHSPSSVNLGAGSTPLLAANANRKYLLIQNQSPTEDIYIRTDGGAAVADKTAFKLSGGQTWEPPVAPTGAINAIRGAGVAVDVHVIQA
jgi:hypothetical protein